jgi:hypothetical protein
MPLTRPDRQPSQPLTADQWGFIASPLAASIFFGLVLTIVVYSALEQTGAMSKLGPFGPLLPLVVIALLMVGVYKGIKQFKSRATRIRIKTPLYMRSLMNDCLERTCGALERRLNTPAISSTMILNDILQDKMLHICATDCLRFSDIRRQIEGRRFSGTNDLVLARFFVTNVDYRKQALPDEIRQVAETVSRSRPDLKESLERLKNAHQALCTGTGNILTLLPPDEKRVEKIRSTYRYRPPTPQRAQRMVFALETMTYLKANRHENVNPMDRRRYDAVADQLIPKLGEALTAYKQAWQDLVDAYERLQSERSESAVSPPNQS